MTAEIVEGIKASRLAPYRRSCLTNGTAQNVMLTVGRRGNCSTKAP